MGIYGTTILDLDSPTDYEKRLASRYSEAELIKMCDEGVRQLNASKGAFDALHFKVWFGEQDFVSSYMKMAHPGVKFCATWPSWD